MRRRRIVRRTEVIPINHENGELLMDEIAQESAAGPEHQAHSAEVRRQARDFKTEQYLRDWLPPVLLRGFYKARRGVAKVARVLRSA